MKNAADGILLVDKHEGETSYDVVKRVKSALGGPKTGKVGHAGTLDPFATGLLIILLGQGTKLSHFLMSAKKTYLATMRLGVETDTLDPTGRVVQTHLVPFMTQKQIQEKADGFIGGIEQVPPKFSAVRYKGTRSYKLARKGLEVELKKRVVTVYSLRILSVQLPQVVMKMTCSSGTYVRRIAADLGRMLGPGGHLISLRRLSSGTFDVQNALRSEEIFCKEIRSSLLERTISLNGALPEMYKVQVTEQFAERIRNGYQPTLNELDNGLGTSVCENRYVKLVSADELVAIIKLNKNGVIGHDKLKIKKVFS